MSGRLRVSPTSVQYRDSSNVEVTLSVRSVRAPAKREWTAGYSDGCMEQYSV